MHQKLEVDNRRTSAYYPQSNGLVEAHNKILKRFEMLFKTRLLFELK